MAAGKQWGRAHFLLSAPMRTRHTSLGTPSSAAVDPAIPRVALVQGGLTEAQTAVVGAYWNVSRYDFSDWSHRKDALWSLTQYERVLYIDGDVLVLPRFDRRKVERVFRAPPGFYNRVHPHSGLGFQSPDGFARIMAQLEPIPGT